MRRLRGASWALAPASVVAPFSYSSLIWATLLGFLVWQELPDAMTWVGASLIVGAGLYIFFRERHLTEKSAADETAD